MERQPDRAPTLGVYFRERELWALWVLPLIVFFRPLFLGEVFFFRDLYLHFLPQKMLLAELIHSFQLPLWDPYLHGGQPFLADLSSQVLYPTGLLYLVLPATRALSIDIVLHIVMAGTGAYLLARVLGMSPPESMISGLVYGFCGYSLSLINLLHRLFALPYLPFILLFWHLSWTEGKRKWFRLSVLCSAIQVLSGAPEFSLITTLTLLCWSFFYPYERSLKEILRRWVTLAALAIGIAGLQVLPTSEMFLQTQMRSASQELTWSLNPRRLPELLVDHFLGETDTLSAEDYWGASIVDQQFPYILSIYLGWPILVLTIIGSNRMAGVNRGVQIFLLLMACSSLILSFGRFLPYFDYFRQVNYLISWFRFPIKCLSGALLPIALLAGYGSRRLFRIGAPGKRFFAWTGLSTLLAGLVLLLFRLNDSFAFEFLQVFFHRAESVIRERLFVSMLRSWLFWPAILMLFLYRRIRSHSVQPYLMVLIVMVDLITASRGLNPTVPEQVLLQTPESARIVKNEIGESRFYRTQDDFLPVLKAPTNDVIWQYRWNLDTLYSYLGAFYRIPVIFHEDFDRLANARIVRLTELIHQLPWSRKIGILSSASVSMIGSFDEIPDLHKIAVLENASNLPFFLYRNQHSKPLVSFHTEGVFVTSEEQALHAMSSSGFDPQRYAVIENTDRRPSCDSSEAKIEPLVTRPNRLQYLVTNRCSGYLVFSYVHYLGWEVLVNGQPVPVYRTNSAFSGVFLEPGQHEVERRYRPLSHVLGLALSFISVIVLFLWKGEAVQS